MFTEVDSLSPAQKKKLAKLRKEAKDRERNFKKMNKARKRVAIAKDVIAQVKDGKIIAEAGTWHQLSSDAECRELEGPTGINRPDDYLEEEDEEKLEKVLKQDVRDILLINQAAGQECTVCAIGALWNCAVIRKDNIALGKFQSQSLDKEAADVLLGYFEKFFDPKQLQLIENCFEDGHGGTGDDLLTTEEHSMACQYGEVYDFNGASTNWYGNGDNDRKRLIHIMENIIRNKGTFVLNKADFDEYNHAEEYEQGDF